MVATGARIGRKISTIAGHSNGQPSRKTSARISVIVPHGGSGIDSSASVIQVAVPRRAKTAPKIFDAMRVCKGPSFGTVFSLACPFALLAHYTELDWAESCGVPRNLIRLGVGLEGIAIAERAYQQARAYARERVQGTVPGVDHMVIYNQW